MIAKGTTHNNGAKLAAYMTTGKPGERAELWQLRGFASDDIKEAFRSVHVIADATQCQKPLFHVQVRNPEGETLTREQWERVADRIESKLGYSDQPRAIAFHRDEKTGHEHMHIAWSRIDGETMTAQPLPFFKLRLKEACRELENELDLTPVRNERESPVMAPNRDQDEQARRLGVDLREVRQTIRDCWERADNGASFRAALADEGLTLAKGDRRDYIVIDREGGMHALGKRVLGTTAAETRARMADIDREQLPSVEKAREHLAIERDAQARPACADLDSQPARNEAIRTEQVEQFVALDMPTPTTTAKSNEIEITVIATTTVETLEAAPAGPLGMLTGLAEGINDGLKMFGAITALFGDDKPAPPPTKEIAIALKQERVAHAERLLHEREYRRQLQREQEEDKQRRAETERKREDDERERTRQRY